eukprot:gene5950-7410_t
MNTIVWNENSTITVKEIFQSVVHIFWFSVEVVSMHYGRVVRSLIQEDKEQRFSDKVLDSDPKSKIPSFIISDSPIDYEGFYIPTNIHCTSSNNGSLEGGGVCCTCEYIQKLQQSSSSSSSTPSNNTILNIVTINNNTNNNISQFPLVPPLDSSKSSNNDNQFDEKFIPIMNLNIPINN